MIDNTPKWVLIQGKSRMHHKAHRIFGNEQFPTSEGAWDFICKEWSMDRGMLGRTGVRVEIWRGHAHQGELLS